MLQYNYYTNSTSHLSESGKQAAALQTTLQLHLRLKHTHTHKHTHLIYYAYRSEGIPASRIEQKLLLNNILSHI